MIQPTNTEWDLPAGDPVPAQFFARPSDVVAPDLVGKILWRVGVGGGRLTEVEAYLPVDDPACHASRGPTRRNQAMFGPPGSLYLYLSYGVHVLLNLVCDRESLGSAVLVRSFEPLGDTSRLRFNREGTGSRPRAEQQRPAMGWLSCGPGRVGQALGLGLDLNGLFLGQDSGLYVIDDGWTSPLAVGTRVGITKGDTLPLRFFAADSVFVTRRRQSRGGLEVSRG